MLNILIGTIALASSKTRGANILLTYDASGNQTSQQFSNGVAPIITGQPNSKQIVVPGGSVGFSVNVASVLPLTYQWYFNGAAISGATSDSYFLTNFAASMEGSYTVVATNSLGSVTSAVATPYIDSNGNGLPDSWEMQYFGNLNQAAGGDYDGDGITNIQEFFDGTNPTVRQPYNWIATSGNFNTAANWDRNQVPGAGDTAVISSGTFTLPTNVTNTTGNVTVNVPFTAAAGANYTLNIAGNWTFNGSVTLTSGYQFGVIGGGTASVAGITDVDGIKFVTDGGSTLSFPNVTTATVPANLSVTWLAQNAGSTLSFPSLTTITGPATPNNYLNLHVQYNSGTTGAAISLPALTTITKADDGDQYNDSGVEFYAYDYGTISAPNLSTFHDNDSHGGPNSGLTAANNGVLSLPKLLAPQGVNSINVNAQSNPQQFTSLVGTSSFEVNAGTVAMSKLASIVGFSNITVDNGAQLSFPNVTTYTSPANLNVQWVSQHNGSTLSFPNLTTITGPATPNTYLNLIAQYDSNATLSLPVLTTITKADDGDPYANSGVEFYAHSGGVISAPNLATFNDNDSHPNSGLEADGTGVLSAPKLLAPVGVNVNLNALSNPQQFTSLVGTSSFEVNGGTVTMTNLASVAGFSSITVDNGAQLSFPNVTSYTSPANLNVQWLSQHSGSALSFPNLTTITGPATPNTYLNLIAQYDGGATISLPALTTITKADDGDSYANSGVEFYAYSGGVIWAPNLATFKDNDSHPDSSFNATGTGTMFLPSLAQSGTRGVTLNGVTLPATITSAPVASSVISSLPCTITTPGIYVLDANLSSAQASGNLITVNASNVVINFQNYTVSGPNATTQTTVGIYASEVTNVTIENGTIVHCNTGICLAGNNTTTTNNLNQHIDNMRVSKCNSQGIEFTESPASLITNCQISQIGLSTSTYSAGISLYGTGVTVQGCTISTITAASGSNSYCISAVAGSFARQNQLSSATVGLSGGIYQDNVARACANAFTNGTDAGGNSND